MYPFVAVYKMWSLHQPAELVVEFIVDEWFLAGFGSEPVGSRSRYDGWEREREL